MKQTKWVQEKTKARVFTPEFKLKIVKRYLKGESRSELAREIWGHKYKTRERNISEWVRLYKRTDRTTTKKVDSFKYAINTLHITIDKDFNLDSPRNEREVKFVENWRTTTVNRKKLVIRALYNKYKGTWSRRDIMKVLRVPKSTYYSNYEYKGRTLTEEEIKISKIIKTIYDNSNGVYGRQRIWYVLRDKYSIDISEKRVYRLMKHLKIKSTIRNPKHAREKKNVSRSHPNLIKMDFKTTRRNQKWFTDVTFIRTSKRKMTYLSVTIDSFDNRIVAWEYSLFNDSNLVVKTLKKSLRNLPMDETPILHSDHSATYFNEEYVKLCKKRGIKLSMGEIGISLENRPVEYFFSILKTEYLKKLSLHLMTPEEVKSEITKFMYWYNNMRIQPVLNGAVPHRLGQYNYWSVMRVLTITNSKFYSII